jgi:hypothetical protein
MISMFSSNNQAARSRKVQRQQGGWSASMRVLGRITRVADVPAGAGVGFGKAQSGSRRCPFWGKRYRRLSVAVLVSARVRADEDIKRNGVILRRRRSRASSERKAFNGRMGIYR